MQVKNELEEVKELLEHLTGSKIEALIHSELKESDLFKKTGGLGFNQFNELLLIFGQNRINQEFFQFLVDGNIKYSPGSKIVSVNHLKGGVENFQRVALLFFGNIRFAFKELSRDSNKLTFYLSLTSQKDINDFRNRQNPIKSTTPIDAEKTFFLGHLIEKQIKERLNDPKDSEAKRLEEERKKFFEIGKANFEAYLTYDHMDVYVATSMREKHEYYLVNKLCEEIFHNQLLQDLKVRWFDPTQASCTSRIDKGLAEALMLKRAKCTLYLVQETDTLGKDSELASTLAQGKPVIAYVPIGDNKYFDKLFRCVQLFNPDFDERKVLLFLLQIINPSLAWKNRLIQEFLLKSTYSQDDVNEIKDLLLLELRQHYDNRAKLLSEDHPLGIQVNLTSGVANGLLVVRTPEKCAKIISDVILGTLNFDIFYDNKDGKNDIHLIERESNCIFRIVTSDQLLTNSFWNFYLIPENNK